MFRRNKNSTNMGAWFSEISNIVILLVILMAIAAATVGLWRSQRGFFLSGLGTLIFIVLLSYADAGRFRGDESSQEGIPPLGLAKGSVRAILAFALIAGFGLYIYYATFASKPDQNVFTALSSIISAVVGFYFGSRSTSAGEPAVGVNAPTVSGINPERGIIGTMVDIINLVGTNFRQGATVSLVRGDEHIPGKSVNVINSSKVTCSFDLSQISQAGKWNVVVTNPDGQKGILDEGFEIQPITSP